MALDKLLNEEIDFVGKLNISSTERVQDVKSFEKQSNSYFIYRVACFVLISLVFVLFAALVFMIHR
jgi:hypothetical protein